MILQFNLIIQKSVSLGAFNYALLMHRWSSVNVQYDSWRVKPFIKHTKSAVNKESILLTESLFKLFTMPTYLLKCVLTCFYSVLKVTTCVRFRATM